MKVGRGVDRTVQTGGSSRILEDKLLKCSIHLTLSVGKVDEIVSIEI